MQKQTFIHRIKGVIFSPFKTFEEVVENDGFEQAFDIIIISILLSILFSFALYSLGFQGMNETTTDIKSSVRLILSWLIGSGIATIIGRIFFKGKGRFKDMLTVVGFAQVPSIIVDLIMIMLLIPVGLISFVVHDNDILGLMIYVPMGILYLISMLYMTVLAVIGIKAAHRFDSYWEAIITAVILLIPLAIVFLFILL